MPARFSDFNKSKSTALFCVLMAVIYLLLMAKAVCPYLQNLFMAQFHLRYQDQKDFPKWAALQFIPSMYNFSNEIWYSNRLIEGGIPIVDDGILHLWFNHYPLRFVSFANYRDLFFAGGREHFIYLRSCYRGQCLNTKYEIIANDKTIQLKEF